MKRKTFSLLALALVMCGQGLAQNQVVNIAWPDWMPRISGTIRAKGEYQPNEKEGRFEVRNARVAFDGQIIPSVVYKAEIDFSDEGRIRMLDAYAGLKPLDGLILRLGQMRVPFSIDAHRSPHVQYFVNRSFIAKQVGDVRDVGFAVTYKFKGCPLTLEGGFFNGSGLTDQKDYWTKSLNFSAKVNYQPFKVLTLQASMQKISPTGGNVWLYDGGATLHAGHWTLEAEYLRKHYENTSFHDVNALDAFLAYDVATKKVFRNVRFLTRFDMMDDHSDGKADENGQLTLTDGARRRLTGGVTLSLAGPLQADIRLNYEKYFYDDIALAKPSERDKAVVELMIHF